MLRSSQATDNTSPWSVLLNRRFSSAHDQVDNEPAISTGEVYPSSYLPAMKALWLDDGVQQCYSRAHEFALQENMP